MAAPWAWAAGLWAGLGTARLALAQAIETASVPLPPSASPWLDALRDPTAMGLGGLVVLAMGLPLALWQHVRITRLEEAIAQERARGDRSLECLATSPDGFFAWMGDGEAVCSRRLAVLLGLMRGMEADFSDILAAFIPEDSHALERASDRLRAEGQPFDMELTLVESGRRLLVHGIRAEAPDASHADLIWMKDVSDDAGVVEDLARSLKALAEDATYLKALLDALPIPVWLRDEDLSLMNVNRAYARAVDAPTPEAAVAHQTELAADNLVREARALAARARAAGQSRHESFHLVLGGERRLTTLTEVPFQVGETLLTAGFALDQSAADDLQTQLDQHLTAHAEVLERLSTAIAIYSTDTRLSFFNTAFAKLWRLDTDWLEGQPTYGNVLDVLREKRILPEVADYRAHKEEELKRFISLIDAIETLLHLPDGRTLRRTISAHPHGGLIYTYEDVTDSLALERSFNTAMAVQRETLDHLHEAIAVFGVDSRLKLSNPAFARLWRLEPEDLAGEPHLHEVISRFQAFFAGRPDRTSAWTQARTHLLALASERKPQDLRLERQDGTILDTSSVPLPDGATLMTWLDVSDSARVERALVERNEALAAADALKSEFIANVANEVAKPLTTVIGFAELLGAEYFGKLTKRQHEYIRGISGAGEALKTLISDVLDLAAIEAGQLRLELDTVDIHPVLTSVLALVRERVRAKKLSLDFDCPPDIGWVVADQRRLRQVMFNLIGNAVKYTPQGGAILVRAERQKDELILIVRDSGTGIAPQDQDRMFQSFVRGRDHSSQEGAGLGLALVHRFVELHGGRVDLISGPDQGTQVTVRLPCSQES